MFGLDALELGRLQFAFTISFHIIFPAISIGLASYLAVLEGLWLKTKREVYYDLYRFWLQIFAVTFGMGVVSGVVMSYQFGTNWAGLSTAAGSIMGPLLTYEVLTAFFLEAGFLGIMLFGMNKVGRGLHFFATLMVAIGTLISTFWILSSNSWMQTPQGHSLVDGVFYPESWWDIVFNPSFPYRLTHMVIAAYLTTAFVVGAVGAGDDPGQIRPAAGLRQQLAQDLLAADGRADPIALLGLGTHVQQRRRADRERRDVEDQRHLVVAADRVERLLIREIQSQTAVFTREADTGEAAGVQPLLQLGGPVPAALLGAHRERRVLRVDARHVLGQPLRGPGGEFGDRLGARRGVQVGHAVASSSRRLIAYTARWWSSGEPNIARYRAARRRYRCRSCSQVTPIPPCSCTQS